MTNRSTRWTELVAPVLLTVCFVFAAGSVLGLAMSDDSRYMQNSWFLNASTFAKYREWAPLYTVWFQALSLVCRDPIHRYFLSWGLLVSLLGLIPSSMKLRSAWLYTVIVLATPIFTIWPFVSLLAAAIILLSICCLLRLRKLSLPASAAAACLVCFVLSFVRPEFDYGVYTAAVAAFALLSLRLLRSEPPTPQNPRRPRTKASIALHLGLALGVLGLAAATHSLQVHSHSDAPRSGMAFAQHFTLRAMRSGLISPTDNWLSDYPERAFGIDRGHNPVTGTATVADFYHANPHLFLSHVARNLADPHCFLCLLLLAGVVLCPWLKNDAKPLRAPGLFLLLVSFPIVSAMLLVYPRTHYAVVIFPALTIYALETIKLPAWRTSFAPWVVGLGCAWIWTLNVGTVLRSSLPASDDRMTLRHVQCIYTVDQAMGPNNQLAFATETFFPIYLTHRRAVIDSDVLTDWHMFQRWVGDVRPAWIAMDSALAKRYGVAPNEMDRYIKQDLGYTPHPCPFEAQLTVYTNDAP